MAHLGSQPVCSRVVEERLDHVTDGVRIEQGFELHLAAVDVPLGEVGVHLAVPRRVDLAVAPFVPAETSETTFGKRSEWYNAV